MPASDRSDRIPPIFLCSKCEGHKASRYYGAVNGPIIIYKTCSECEIRVRDAKTGSDRVVN